MRLTSTTVHRINESSVERPQTAIGIGPHIQFGNSNVSSVNGTLNRTTQ
jgi:hypothetical protein